MPRRGRCRPSSAAPASPLDNDDILREILLRLPPRPSSLPRASFVSHRWRRLVSDPQFLRRFRAHHRTPPLLGFYSGATFVPTLDPPDRIPAARFSLDPQGDEAAAWKGWYHLSCCRGLVLGCDSDSDYICVFDPVSGHRHRVPSPVKVHIFHPAVLPRADSIDRRLFRIVAVFSHVHRGILVSVYSSESGVWISVLPSDSITSPEMIISRPSTLVGDAIYWMLGRQGILKFDFDRQSLAIIELPLVDADFDCNLLWQIMPAEGGQLGLAVLANLSIQFWDRETNHGSPATWVLRKTVQSDKLLPPGHLPKLIMGFSEENNVIFLTTYDGSVFMVHLETMQSRKVLGQAMYHIIPYSSF